jgi:hypothetical protein
VFAIFAAMHRASSRVSSVAADPIGLSCPFAIIPERDRDGGGQSGRKAMEWFKGKTSIAGIQVSNWTIALAAVVIVWIIFRHLN